jgi:nitrate/nitrite transporter NarK
VPPPQLALDNALAPYFQNNFGFGITKAANLAAIFGMMNFVARPCGGLFSDLAARRWGMRGRIWILWICVAGGGAALPPWHLITRKPRIPEPSGTLLGGHQLAAGACAAPNLGSC